MLDSYANRWALVTGASSGIGAEFATRLAELGMHLVLVARRGDLLEQLARDLDTKHGTRCEIQVSDLAGPGAVKDLVDAIDGKNIAIELLINNAGFGLVGEIDTTDVERAMQMVRLNVGAVTELTYRLVPRMLERGHGGVINVASVAGFQPVAYMGAYAATKAFVLHFSEALWAETRDRGVTVTALCPGVTRTDFFDIAGVAGWLKKQRSHSPRQVVKSALRALEKGRQFSIPGLKNYFLALLVRMAPRKIVVKESMKYFRPPRKPKDEPETKPADPPKQKAAR